MNNESIQQKNERIEQLKRSMEELKADHFSTMEVMKREAEDSLRNYYIKADNLYDIQKAEIVKRLYDNLSLDKLEEIEAELISKYKKYKMS